MVAWSTGALYSRTSEEALSRSLAAQESATRAERSAQEIQSERRRSLVLSCQETNQRNREARQRAEEVVGNRASRRVTLLFIDALAPYRRDCVAYAQSRVAEP